MSALSESNSDCRTRDAPMHDTSSSVTLHAFCEAILGLIGNGGTNDLSPVLAGLTQAIGNGCDQTLIQLQGEARALGDAAEQLRSLSRSQLFRLGNEVAVALEWLESNRSQLLGVIDSLSSLRSAGMNGMKLPETRQLSPHDESPHANLGLPCVPALALAESMTETPSPVTDEASCAELLPLMAPVGGAQLADRERAEALCRDAETWRLAGDLARSEHLYTEAVRIDGDFVPAVLNRGRVRLLRGKPDHAIEDFTKAIRLNACDPVAYCWRGDAHSIISRFDAAIVDYSRSLELQADFLLAKYNRAVVYRQHGDLNLAMTEFDEILQLRPEHGPAYLNRGIVNELQGNPARALTDYRKALRYQPTSQEALQRLQAVRVLLDDVDVPTTVPPPNPPYRSNTPPTSSSPSSLSTVPTPREVHDSLAVRCPGCFNETFIRWNKLQPGRVMSCPHCQRNFTLKPSGELSEVVKAKTGRWMFRETIDSHQKNRQQRRLQLIAGVVSALVILVMFWWAPRVGQSAAQVEEKLPSELEPRAELFARAWLTGNSRLMRRMTDPVQDRLLFTWSRRNPPPHLASSPETLEKDVKVEVIKLPSQPPHAWLRIRFERRDPTIAGPPVEIRLAWQERSGVWFFQPNPQQ